jgi:hypothetical protein
MEPEALTRALGGRWHGRYGLASCPAPGHGKGLGDRYPSLSISYGSKHGTVVCCHGGCSQRDILIALESRGVRLGPEPMSGSPPADHLICPNGNSTLAARLWQSAIPVQGTAAETYLEARGLAGIAPPTLCYLGPTKRHAHAMIAACALVDERVPGQLNEPPPPPAIHLTRLSVDGRTRTSKTMLGPVSGHPFVLAPPNDGLGLVITEGIEDALSLHLATGLGAWAAGSAGHMVKLGSIVPDYIECVTLAEDANETGRRACARLAEQLAGRGIEVRLLRIGA